MIAGAHNEPMRGRRYWREALGSSFCGEYGKGRKFCSYTGEFMELIRFLLDDQTSPFIDFGKFQAPSPCPDTTGWGLNLIIDPQDTIARLEAR